MTRHKQIARRSMYRQGTTAGRRLPGAPSDVIVAADRLRPQQASKTLVFSAHDEVHNDAVALRDFLLGRPATRKVETARTGRLALLWP